MYVPHRLKLPLLLMAISLFMGFWGPLPRSEAGVFSRQASFSVWWDKLNLSLCNSQWPEADWSDGLVVFRASRELDDAERYGLADVNAGNYAGELRFLYNQQALLRSHYKKSDHHFLTAYLVAFNTQLTSDYFHCEQGACEVRHTYRNGLSHTPLAELSTPYIRVGIKKDVGSIQISRCRLGHVCAKDVCPDYADALARFNACATKQGRQQDCFYGFTAAGEGLSYKILARSQTIVLNWQLAPEEQLDILAAELLRGEKL